MFRQLRSCEREVILYRLYNPLRDAALTIDLKSQTLDKTWAVCRPVSEALTAKVDGGGSKCLSRSGSRNPALLPC